LIPASEPGSAAAPANPHPVALLGLPLWAVDFEAAKALLVAAATRSRPSVVVTPNVDHFVRLHRRPDLKALYAQADYMFADGMPVVWASRLFGRPLPGRVTGADLFVALCREALHSGRRVFVLGGMPGQEAFLRERYAQVYPGLQVELFCPAFGFDPAGAEARQALERMQQFRPAYVFVCLGFEKQERWAMGLGRELPGGVVLCVGAAQEFALGLKRRAPLWMQRSGLEWLWRLLSNPRQLWRRYLLDGPVFLRLLWQAWRQDRA